MDSPLSRPRAFVLSIFATATVNILKFYPPSDAAMDAVEAVVARNLGIPSKYEWLAKVVLFVVTTFVIYGIVKSPIGVWSYNRIASGIRWVLAHSGRRRNLFAAEERESWEFKQDVLHSSKHSARMFCLLVSAYTMVHEEERFMLRDWLKSKELRVLLLDRKGEVWHQRARLFIEKRLSAKGRDEEHYRAECEIAEQELKNTYHAQIAFYNAPARWRLYIFDDRIFVSRYSGPPEGEFSEARDRYVAAFPREHPMYHWLYGEFLRLAPEDWRMKMPKPEM